MSKRPQIEALTDPHVRAWLDVHRHNAGYSYQAVLEEMVIVLAGQVAALQALRVEELAKSVPIGLVEGGRS